MTTFIKELLDIPEQVQRGDFVLRLAEGVNRAEETLRDYVVTPELQACFDESIPLIQFYAILFYLNGGEQYGRTI
jgi:hypothetical protein